MKIQEQTRTAASGYLALVVLPVLTLLFGWLFIRSAVVEAAIPAVLYMIGLMISLICYKGLFMVHPNQAKVLQLFGTYVGSRSMTAPATRSILRRWWCGESLIRRKPYSK